MKARWGFVAIGPDMHIVYILKSRLNPSKTYTGITHDLEKRLKEHNEDKSYYTKRYAPWYVETYIVFNDKAMAEAFEKYLKEGSGQAFMTKRLLPLRDEAK
jgi:putative endonuclease